MNIKLLLTVLVTTFSFGSTFCYEPKNDTHAKEWEKVVQDKILHNWITNHVKQNKTGCIVLSEIKTIENAQEIIDAEPTSSFYFK